MPESLPPCPHTAWARNKAYPVYSRPAVNAKKHGDETHCKCSSVTAVLLNWWNAYQCWVSNVRNFTDS
jgi:hypothetical protein